MPTDVISNTGLILSPNEAAEFLGLAKATLAKCRCCGGGPAYLKLGRKVAYRLFDLEEWLVARRVSSTSDADRLPRRLTNQNSGV
jgi:predicted DNA-binding transcriptional regulator AlpA